MTIVQSVELFTAINLAVIGLSHFLQPKVWAEFFIFLHSKGQPGNLFNAMLSLGAGSIILSFHFIWTWPAVLVTGYGTAQVLKGLIYLTIPSVGLKSIGRITTDRAAKFRWVGLIMFILSLLLGYSLIS